MKRILSLTALAALVSACGGARDAQLEDASAYLGGACPTALRGADVEVRDTDHGVAMEFTTDDPARVTALRQLGARMAMEHTQRFDPLPDMEQRTDVVVQQLPDGQQQVLVQEVDVGLPPGGTAMTGEPASHATVVGVPGGVRVVLEARDPNELGTIRQTGVTFVDRLRGECDLG